MDLGMSDRVKPLVEKVRAMVRDEIAPLDAEYEAEIGRHPSGDRFQLTERQTEIMDGLKARARERGLWNFWLTDSEKGYGLTTVEYAYLAEEMGKVGIAAEVFNCAAPDTGNMEVLERYGTPAHKARWLEPLLDGRDPLGLPDDRAGRRLLGRHQHRRCEAERDGDEYVLNGEKWWASRRRRSALRGLHRHGLHRPRRAASTRATRCSWSTARPPGHRGAAPDEGVRQRRRAARAHAHPLHRRARAGEADLILGEGRGFEVAQGRLGPGRIHHCMRAIGQAEAALETDVPPGADPHRLRQAAGAARRQPRHHRQRADGDRAGAPALPQDGMDDGHRRRPAPRSPGSARSRSWRR